MAGSEGVASVGVALAGGGPEGAVYEIGALRALEESVEGLDLTRLPVVVGVSAGAFVGACLANRISPAGMCRAMVSSEPGEHPFVPHTFFRPALASTLRRTASLPRRFMQALADVWRHPEDLSVLESMLSLSYTLPAGVFDNDEIRRYLAGIFSMKGRTDDFRRLSTTLLVVATDLGRATPAVFGPGGIDDVAISRAVQASTAFPGLYPPVIIGGRHYVDGVLCKTVHASAALDRGARLVLCVNPIVPVEVEPGSGPADSRRRTLLGRGLPGVLSQTFRTMIDSRKRLGLATYGDRYPGADVLVFEPRRDDLEMFFTNIFSFSSRKAVLEHAYRTTRRALFERRDSLAPVFARHGLRLRTETLAEDRDLWVQVGLRGPARQSPAARADGLLDRVEAVIRGRQEGRGAQRPPR